MTGLGVNQPDSTVVRWLASNHWWLSGTALWYRTGIALSLYAGSSVRDPLGAFDVQSFFLHSAHRSAAPDSVLVYLTLVCRTTLEEGRAHLGLETQRQWSTLGYSTYHPAPVWACSPSSPC